MWILFSVVAIFFITSFGVRRNTKKLPRLAESACSLPPLPPVFNFRSDCISVTTHVLTWKSTNLNVDSLAANAFSRYICPLEFELKKRKKFHRPLMWRLLGFNFVSPPRCSTLLNTLHFPTNKMLGFPPKMSLKYSDIAYHANRSTKAYNLYKLVDFIQQWNNPLNCLIRLALQFFFLFFFFEFPLKTSFSPNVCRTLFFQIKYIFLPGYLKTGLPEIWSQVQHIGGILSTQNLLKAAMLLV